MCVEVEMFVVDWFMSLFARSFQLEVACRIWDGFFVFGEIFLFRVVVGLLKVVGKEIVGAREFSETMLVCFYFFFNLISFNFILFHFFFV